MRFDLSESRAFLVELGGLALEETDVAQLEQTTDGWVAALQLASLSLRDSADPAALIRGISDVITRWASTWRRTCSTRSADVLDFLLATSVCDRICGDLACALAGLGDGQAMLEQPEGGDLFLRRLDEEREWFRYHHLFAEYLQRRLDRDQPDRITRLHAPASRGSPSTTCCARPSTTRWRRRRGTRDGADRTARARADRRGADASLQALVSKLTPHIVVLSPQLQLSIAWANTLVQRQAAARAALNAFDPPPKSAR